MRRIQCLHWFLLPASKFWSIELQTALSHELEESLPYTVAVCPLIFIGIMPQGDDGPGQEVTVYPCNIDIIRHVDYSRLNSPQVYDRTHCNGCTICQDIRYILYLGICPRYVLCKSGSGVFQIQNTQIYGAQEYRR